MNKLVALLCVCCCVALGGCSEELDWREWRAPDGSFSVLLPAKPQEASREITVGAQRFQFHMVSATFEGLAFGVAYADPAQPDDPVLLKEVRDNLTKNILASVTREQAVDLGFAKGIEFHAQGTPGGKPMAMSARLLSNDRRFYQVLVIGREERVREADVDLFLRSFTPLK